jgi:hypothetical protein
MPTLLQATDGRWRKWDIFAFVIWFALAVYDFIREGLGSLSGINYLLFAIGVAALAPYAAEAKENRAWWYFPRSPRAFLGAVAYLAAIGVVIYRMTHQHH